MPNKVIRIQDYTAKSSDIFFFDNNIWMYIFCPIGNYKTHKQKAYSGLLQNLISRGLHIYTNSLILSEFSNRYLRLDYDIERKKVLNAGKYNDFKKDFVGSPRFTSTVNDVKTSMQQIYKLCQKCSDEFHHININEVFSLFKSIGFNDSYYIHQASLKKWIIVSDDSDFTKNSVPDKNLTILTY